ncbi:MAG: phosphatase PAP2 family protein [Arthrobacter sp.]|uniref:phosphatase PAP2 family protein n=1 Tax=unclassified Arthrobacter TaxID=235627 RepID=UPI00264DBD4A|nr:phosphatidic acid phosphatase [Micrococcaceae bacterium]MDN5812255.1 phosphatidic acid phosphatase [Micrococcaceae bacterium]MDN5822700.1 phosphatidic acid phosphatase [Micrococcaceae bacterium]MDN5878164.1 phosphatidic acid phosphatase [Micrococcaceae bacterium]MDN5886556.1 phosphatidic acid phosphatase [Micrococcaceae bacterium]
MDIDPGNDVDTAPRRGSPAARTVTTLLSPVVLVSAYLLVLPLRSPDTTWLQAIVALVFTTGLPWLGVVWMKHRGRVTDLHVRERSQRRPVFVLAGASLLIGGGALVLLRAPAAVFSALGLILAGLLICLVVNLRWKISVHTAVAAFIWLEVFSDPDWGAAAALFLTLLVGWSRLELRRHTPGQVLAGALVGCIVFAGGLALP